MNDGIGRLEPRQEEPEDRPPRRADRPERAGRARRDARQEPKPIATLRQLRHAPRHGRRAVLLGRLPVHAVEVARGGEGRRRRDRCSPSARAATSTTSTWTATSRRRGTARRPASARGWPREVLRTFDKLKPAADGPLRVSSAMIELPLAPVTADEVAAAKLVIADVQAGEEAGAEVPRSGAGVQGGRRGRAARQAAARSRCR